MESLEPVRLEPVGLDRHWNRYWLLPASALGGAGEAWAWAAQGRGLAPLAVLRAVLLCSVRCALCAFPWAALDCVVPLLAHLLLTLNV